MLKKASFEDQISIRKKGCDLELKVLQRAPDLGLATSCLTGKDTCLFTGCEYEQDSENLVDQDFEKGLSPQASGSECWSQLPAPHWPGG